MHHRPYTLHGQVDHDRAALLALVEIGMPLGDETDDEERVCPDCDGTGYVMVQPTPWSHEYPRECACQDKG